MLLSSPVRLLSILSTRWMRSFVTPQGAGQCTPPLADLMNAHAQQRDGAAAPRRPDCYAMLRSKRTYQACGVARP